MIDFEQLKADREAGTDGPPASFNLSSGPSEAEIRADERERAAKIAEGFSFPMNDTAAASIGLPTAGKQVAEAIRKGDG